MPKKTKTRQMKSKAPAILSTFSGDVVGTVLAERSLAHYTRQCWAQVEPGTPYAHNWHIDVIAEHLQAVTEGEIRKLIINMPPRCMKSTAISVAWPTWVWIGRPETKFLFGSYRQDLATRDALKSRRLIQSFWYQSRWGDRFRLAGDQNVKMRYENDHAGHRIALSVGTGTGEGGDVLVLDDPHNGEDVHSDTMREGDIDWWNQTWSTRKNDPKLSAEVIVMQRLHERDISGVAAAEIGGYEHLMIPMRFESERKCYFPITTSIGDCDPRTKDGELLWPGRFDEDAVGELERRLGSYGSAGQLQQRPAPAEGGIIKKRWLRFWYPVGATTPPPVRVRLPENEWAECEQIQLPEKFEATIQSWDMAFKDTKTSNFVSGHVWGKSAANAFLLDRDHGKKGLPESVAAVHEMSEKWPDAAPILIEDKANGPAVISVLQDKISGIQAVNPEGSKIGRANAVSPYIESGNVYLPHPAFASWVNGFIAELTTFPAASNDDDVDAMTQALYRLFRRTAKAVVIGDGQSGGQTGWQTYDARARMRGGR
jgi:predicted phage terminase large subunit-like protein